MNSILKKIISVLYTKKVKNGFFVYKVLCFKTKKKIEDNNFFQSNKMFVPLIPNVGKCTYSDPNLFIATDKTKIGAFCSIGKNVVIGHGKHPINYLSTSPYLYFDELGFKASKQVSHEEFGKLEPVEIGNDVWIGEGVFIKNGVKIGDGSVIGAKAVVTKDIPPYAIVAGCPAKILKYRFDEETIKELLELKWWKLSDDIIKQIPYDDMNKAMDFLRKVQSR